MSCTSCKTICKLLHCKNEETVQKPVNLSTHVSFTERFAAFRKRTRNIVAYEIWEFVEEQDTSTPVLYEGTLEFFESEKNVNTDVFGAFYMIIYKKEERKLDVIAGHYSLVDTDIVMLTGYSYGSTKLHIFGCDFDKLGKCTIKLLKVAAIKREKSRSWWDDFESDIDSTYNSVSSVVKYVGKEISKTVEEIGSDVKDTWKATVKSLIQPFVNDAQQILTYCDGTGISLLSNAATIAAALETEDYTALYAAIAQCLTDYVIGKHADIKILNNAIFALINTILIADGIDEELTAVAAISAILTTTSGVTTIANELLKR